MKFGNLNLKEWVYCSSHEWARYEDHFFSSGSVHILKNYQVHDDGAWYIHFHGALSFLNNIYGNTGAKVFNWNEEKEAMKYVDEFMSRMHKLRIFT